MKTLYSLSLLLNMAYPADDLAPYGDEFNNPATFTKWQDLAEVEGWVAPSYEAADIDTTAPGHFHIVPAQNSWYAHLRGLLFFKEIQGNFIATCKLTILSRHNPADPTETPNRPFSLSGIFIHEPRPYITQAAPDPYTTDPVWPPADHGSDYVPNTENYIFLSYGTAGNPGTRQFEIKATRNSNSQLYYASTGIDQNQTDVWLQIVRVGDTVVCLRKHSEAGPWIVENRYPNADHHFPDFGQTLQVGVTAYTDWSGAATANAGGLQTSYHYNYAPSGSTPDLISQVDYFRLRRPGPELTEAVLQAMSVSYNPATNNTAATPVELSASPAAAPYLGENANLIYDPFGDWVTAEFGGAADPADTLPDADPDLDGLPNLLEFALGGDPQAPSSTVLPSMELGELGHMRYQFTPAITDGAQLEVLRSYDLLEWEPVARRELEGGDWQAVSEESIYMDLDTGEIGVELRFFWGQPFFRLEATQ